MPSRTRKPIARRKPVAKRARAAKPVAARRAWLYARVSTRKQSQGQSPKAQLARLARIAELKGWPVVGRGFDRVSSVKAAELLELGRAMKAIQSARANVLMVADLDRLGGDMRQILETAKTIDDCGAHMFIESVQIDTTQGGPIGRFFFHTLAAVAELRRTLQNDKIARGIAEARRRGSRLGRPVVFYPSPKLVKRVDEIRKSPSPPSWRVVAKQLRTERFRKLPSHATLRRWFASRATKAAP
jgi:DNA invertase Pin-like site-specific DNA recombinase